MQAHHDEAHEHSMQSSHPVLPVFGLGGVLPASSGEQIGPPLGQASTGTGHVLLVVA
jgi:hypothetical protein